MKAFEDYHPFVIFIYFILVTLIAMFSMNPLIIILSLSGGIALCILRGRSGKGFYMFIIGIFMISALINPVFYHNGATVLFVVNDNPVTLEAVLYGVFAAAALCALVCWFKTFSQMMTADRLLCVLGIFPKLALLVSMSLRFVPLFTEQFGRVNRTQKSLGLYKEDNLPDNIRGGARVFSVMCTWALENGIITADSMSARGYGCCRRTSYSIHTFRKSDGIMLAAVLALSSVVLTALGTGALDFSYYPLFGELPGSAFTILSYAAYAALALLPSAIEAEESFKWKFLLSKI